MQPNPVWRPLPRALLAQPLPGVRMEPSSAMSPPQAHHALLPRALR